MKCTATFQSGAVFTVEDTDAFNDPSGLITSIRICIPIVAFFTVNHPEYSKADSIICVAPGVGVGPTGVGVAGGLVGVGVGGGITIVGVGVGIGTVGLGVGVGGRGVG